MPKPTHRIIEEKLNSGAKKQEIFDELRGTTSAGSLARSLVLTPYPSDREAHHGLNNALFLLILYFALVKAIMAADALIENPIFYAIPFAAFIPVCSVLLATEVRKYSGYIYRVVYVVGALVFIEGIHYQLGVHDSWLKWLVSDAPVLAGIVIAWRLERLLCPGLGIIGAKKGRAGEYIF